MPKKHTVVVHVTESKKKNSVQTRAVEIIQNDAQSFSPFK